MTEPLPQTSLSYNTIYPGDPAPWFVLRSSNNPEFRFDTIGGRYIMLCFMGSTVTPVAQAAVAAIGARRNCFDDIDLSFFGVTVDPRDESERNVKNIVPGIRFFYDFAGEASRLYGALPNNAGLDLRQLALRPVTYVLDRLLRVIEIVPFLNDGKDGDRLIAAIDRLPPFAKTPEPKSSPPVLILPRIFEPELCKHLIGLYEADGGHESGFMNEEGGKTKGVYNYTHKRRRDFFIRDPALIGDLRALLNRRLVPEIAKAYQYNVTHIERYIVACYSAKDEGHFNAHRDNTTTGTAHRRFAVTLNLNDAFEGGELSFPEFGPQTYRPPPGGAVVFSCSLLHAASVVTSGVRYAFLPFLYDEEAAKIRDANRSVIVEAEYRD